MLEACQKDNTTTKQCTKQVFSIRVETPQHWVLENTLNMGSYFTWIKMILFKARCEKCDASQMREVRTIMW